MRVRASRLGILCESGGLARVEVCYLLETLKQGWHELSSSQNDAPNKVG